MRNQYAHVFSAAIALVTLQATIATAQVSNWQPAGTNVFFWNPTNWDNGVPGAQDEAVFGMIGPFNVDMNFDATIGTFTHAIGTMTLLGGNALEIVNSPELSSFLIITNPGTEFNSINELLVGEFELGGLTLLGGADSNISGFARIGSEAGIEGRLTIIGSGSVFTSQGLTIGDTGQGTLLIQNSGKAVCEFGRVGKGSTSTGQATVAGSGSRWENTNFLSVGESTGSNGELDIENGGVVVAQQGFIGTEEDSDGTINVTGAGSTLSVVDRITVGNDGLGSLNASIGGLILANECRIGRRTTASGIVNLETAAALVCSSVIVGREGSGGLNIGNGSSSATVNCNTAIIGELTAGSGFVNVQGSSSNWNIDNELRVGNNGTGAMFIQDGASVDVGGDTFVNGNVDMNSENSELAVSGLLEVGPNGNIDLFEGPVVIADLLHMSVPSGPGGSISASLESSIFANTVEVGSDGGGTLNLSGGSLLDCSSLKILEFGFVSAAGLGTTVVCDGLQVGTPGGDLSYFVISDSTDVIVMGETTVAAGAILEFENVLDGFAGQLNGNGITEVEGTLGFQDSANFNSPVLVSGPGQIRVEGTAVANLTEDYANFGLRTYVGNDATLNVYGDYSGTAPFQGPGTVNFLGDVHPGTSTGTAAIAFAGNVTLSGTASLGIQLNGTNIGQFDQLMVVGDVTLNGGLEVVAVGGFQPQAGDQFMIVQIDGQNSGAFDGYSEGDVVASIGNVDLQISYVGGNGNDVVLIAGSDSLPGDMNGDGVVNLLDVQPFVDVLTSGQYVAAADINMDGVVNLLDVQPFIEILTGG